MGNVENIKRSVILNRRLTTGASRIDKELTYGEQNVRPLGGAKSEKHCKSVFVHFVVLFIFHHFIAIFLKQIKN